MHVQLYHIFPEEHNQHSLPSQTGGLLSAATAPPHTNDAELETGLKGQLPPERGGGSTN